jgi:hypothetical protein
VIAALTRAPAECLSDPADAEGRESVRLGRVAFRSPVLLGGVASRVGLSCNSCHPNGHANAMFFVAGVSGEPGTADVTGPVFSTTRDDQRDNPVPIPSLVDAASSPPFGTVVPAKELGDFLHAAIVEEFQGRAPPASVLSGLEAYLRALKGSACPDPIAAIVDFESDSRALLETLDVANTMIAREDWRALEFVLLSIQAAMERVYERFPDTISEREGLVDVSRSLSRIRNDVAKREGPGTVAIREGLSGTLSRERVRLVERIARLQNHVGHSFYDADYLRRFFESAR